MPHQRAQCRRDLGPPELLCPFRQVGRIVDIDAAEMEETQLLSVDQPMIARLGQISLLQVPISDVARSIPHDSDRVGESREQVDELLIDEDPSLLFADTV